MALSSRVDCVRSNAPSSLGQWKYKSPRAERSAVPQLQFDITGPLDATDRRAFAEEVAALYADRMATQTDHVAVSIRERDPADLWLGREVEGRLLFLNADVRRGRDQSRRREFALAIMDAARDRWGVPAPNMKVVFTEHAGEDMMGYDRVGGEWSAGEE